MCAIFEQIKTIEVDKQHFGSLYMYVRYMWNNSDWELCKGLINNIYFYLGSWSLGPSRRLSVPAFPLMVGSWNGGQKDHWSGGDRYGVCIPFFYPVCIQLVFFSKHCAFSNSWLHKLWNPAIPDEITIVSLVNVQKTDDMEKMENINLMT